MENSSQSSYSQTTENRNYLAKLRKNRNLSSQKLNNRRLLNSSHFSQKLNEILNLSYQHATSLESFLNSLLNSLIAARFEAIHLFVHEKGNNEVAHYLSTKTSSEITIENVALFQKLFLAIKKSKNRSFGQSTLKGVTFNVIGTFMAREYTLRDHNIIFLVSRNDFLTFSDDDSILFSTLESLLPTYLQQILKRDFNESNTDISKNIIKLAKQENKNFKNSFNQEVVKINHQRRLTILGELLNTFHHEISNPIFGLQLSTELLHSMITDQEDLESIELIKQSILRAQDILKSFTHLYRETQTVEKINFNQLMDQTLLLAKSETKGIQISVEIDPQVNSIDIESNPTWIAQVIFNLVINSAQALNETNVKEKSIYIKIYPLIDQIVIDTTDSGQGIDKDNQKKIFNSFFTTKDTGTGLGLTISKDLASRVGGDLSYVNTGKDFYFRLSLPL